MSEEWYARPVRRRHRPHARLPCESAATTVAGAWSFPPSGFVKPRQDAELVVRPQQQRAADVVDDVRGGSARRLQLRCRRPESQPHRRDRERPPRPIDQPQTVRHDRGGTEQAPAYRIANSAQAIALTSGRYGGDAALVCIAISTSGARLEGGRDAQRPSSAVLMVKI